MDTLQAQHTSASSHGSHRSRSRSRIFEVNTPAQQLYPTGMYLLGCCLLSLLQLHVQASPVFVDNPSLAQFQSGRNIRNLPCIVRKSGRSGVCMFAIDCIKQNGTHLGTCIDRFYFGSCCALKEEASLFAPEINDNSIDQNTISHFSHESTTLPTSALFKLTTESSSTTHNQLPLHANELLKNVTQSYLSTSNPTRTSTTSTTTRRTPAAHTTHKNSHFVVRTTLKPSSTAVEPSSAGGVARPNIAGKPTTAPTTIKPPRRRTTSARPVLTTVGTLEQRIETTTAPVKFVTFQVVETTTSPATESTNYIETTTMRRHTRPTKPRTTGTTASAATAAKTTATTSTTIRTPTTTQTTTTSSTSTARPTPPLRTTTPKPHKPQSSRRPVPVKKPAVTTSTSTSTSTSTTTTSVSASTSSSSTHHKQPTHSKPTRKPIESSTGGDLTNATMAGTTAAAPVRRPIAPLVNTSSSTTSNDELSTAHNQTETKQPALRPTHAPRPKPQPTAEIVKTPVTLADATTKPTPSSRPTATTTTSSAATAAHTKKPSTVTATTAKPTTTTTTSSTTAKPTRRHTTTASSSTSSTTTTTTTTTAAPTATSSLQTSEATKKPGLITWTDVDAEPQTNATISSDWQPVQPADWVPLPTLVPQTATNKTTSSPAASSSATDKVVISVATSVSTSESKPGAAASDGSSSTTNHVGTATTTSRPHRPTKPTLASSTTAEPSSASTTTRTTTTTTTMKTTAAVPSSTASTSSSSSGEDLDTSTATNTEGSTENYPTYTGTGSTEDYNTTSEESSTTLAPANSLEGVDYKEVCGRRMFPEPRIVGGANAAFGRWPWQISLRQWRTSTYLHKCGAALLNENWAITAAHCVDNVPPSDLLLRLGEYDLAEEEEPYGYQERRVQIVASHPQFDPRTFEYDLALLRFYEPVVFQPNIIPVCVPDNDENFIGQTAFVTGWGRLYEDGPLPSVLQEVAVPVINNTICETMYRAAGYIEHIPHIFICAGWKKGGYDSCEGDSGGPMVLQREKDKRFQLGGVISWGIGCAEANQPGVYTRISEFRDWINQILQF